MNTSEQIYQLVREWCFARDQQRASEVLRQIAIVSKCIPDVPEYLNDLQSLVVVHWLQQKHLERELEANEYLLRDNYVKLR